MEGRIREAAIKIAEDAGLPGIIEEESTDTNPE